MYLVTPEGSDISQKDLVEEHGDEITADVSATAVTETATGPTVTTPTTTQEEGEHG